MYSWLVILLATFLIVGGFVALALLVGSRMAAADDRQTKAMREQYRAKRLANPYAHNCGLEVASDLPTAPPLVAPPPVPGNAPLRAELLDDDLEESVDLPSDERARQAWPRFLQLWEAHRRDASYEFLIRTTLHASHAVESCWLRPTTIDGPEYIMIAAVAQTPHRLRSVRQGERVRIRLGAELQKLEDWKVRTPDGVEGSFG